MYVLEEPQENYKTGYIKVFRSLFNHWISQRKDYFYAWIWLLSKANHKTAKILIGGNLVEVKRGEFISSRNKIAQATGMTENKIRKFLKLLEKDAMIIQKTTKQFTKITISNYDTYQDAAQTNHQHTTNRAPTEHQQSTTNNNDKNENNDKEKTDTSLDFYRKQYALINTEIEKVEQGGREWEWLSKVRYNYGKFVKVLKGDDPEYGNGYEDLFLLDEQVGWEVFAGLLRDHTFEEIISTSMGIIEHNEKYKGTKKERKTFKRTLLTWMKR